MKAMSENPPKIAKENSNNSNQVGKPIGTRSVSFK
jgi:hypothetical protein